MNKRILIFFAAVFTLAVTAAVLVFIYLPGNKDTRAETNGGGITETDFYQEEIALEESEKES